MMDWTDRHCRYFLRLIAPRARLYTEMITSGALLHGDVPHHLDFDPAERPLALQLGGSDPRQLAAGAKLGERWGYDEINLNCGCPSERVQTGSFGVGPNGFGFNITGSPDIPLVVDASTNLTAQSWVPLQSCTLTNGLIHFNDPQWSSFSRRLYRIRSP